MPVPSDVERVVLRALEKEPEARFQSAREMDAALAACGDAAGWTRENAAAFWKGFEEKPRSGVASKDDGDEAATVARPSVSSGMKAG